MTPELCRSGQELSRCDCGTPALTSELLAPCWGAKSERVTGLQHRDLSFPEDFRFHGLSRVPFQSSRPSFQLGRRDLPRTGCFASSLLTYSLWKSVWLAQHTHNGVGEAPWAELGAMQVLSLEMGFLPGTPLSLYLFLPLTGGYSEHRLARPYVLAACRGTVVSLD